MEKEPVVELCFIFVFVLKNQRHFGRPKSSILSPPPVHRGRVPLQAGTLCWEESQYTKEGNHFEEPAVTLHKNLRNIKADSILCHNPLQATCVSG